MNKTLQRVLFAVPVVVGVYLIYRQFRPKNRGDKYEADPIPIVPVGGGGGISPSANDDFPLRKGSKGANVKRLQQAMVTIKPDALPRYGVDSDFGTETETALKYLTGSATCTEAQLKDLESRAESVKRGLAANQPLGPNQQNSISNQWGPVYNSGTFF